jgi:hypothetical protein
MNPADKTIDSPRALGKPFLSGNPLGKGRPVGSRNKAKVVLQNLLERLITGK